MVKAILFDMDDTLYPEIEYIFSGYRAVAHWAGEHLHPALANAHPQLINLFRHGTRFHIFNHWLAPYDLDTEDNALTLLDIYRQHFPDISLFPGVIPLLERLRATFALGIVTDGYMVMQEKKLAALELGHFFDTIVMSDRLGKEFWKPSTRPFELALQELNVRGTEAVYVGDNPLKDFLGARQLGMEAIRILRFGGLYSEIEPPSSEHSPSRIIFSLKELEQVVGS